MRHRIKKQYIDVQMDARLDSFRVQQKLSDLYWNFLLPLIAAEFDRWHSHNSIEQIERIYIDLGVIDVGQLDRFAQSEEFIEQIRKDIQQELSHETLNLASGNKISLAEHAFHTWFHYMQTAYLDSNDFDNQDSWDQQILEVLASNLVLFDKFIAEIQNNRIFLLRIIRQQNSSFLFQMIKILLPQLTEEIQEIQNDFLHQLANEGKTNNSTSKKNLENFWLEFIPMCISIRMQGFPAELVKTFKELKVAAVKQNILDQTKPNLEKEGFLTNELKDGLFVEHAGLILIHPFIISLFKNLDLIQNNSFVDQQAKEKAIYLLHYAATGKEKAKEYELLMAKVICSFPIEMPIGTGIVLSELEKLEVEEMLTAVIASWDILKSTSIDGLREGFLVRKGRISLNVEKILIQVEKGAIDMLLDYLPWHLNTIRLPWLKSWIHVEWR